MRARRHVDERRPRFEPSREQRDELARRFIAALQEGETEPLVELLAAGRGVLRRRRRQGAADPGAGRGRGGDRPDARGLRSGSRCARGFAVRPAEVNGEPGLLGFDADGTLIAAMAFEISGGAIQAIRSIVNPDKLAHISSTILPSLPPA